MYYYVMYTLAKDYYEVDNWLFTIHSAIYYKRIDHSILTFLSEYENLLRFLLRYIMKDKPRSQVFVIVFIRIGDATFLEILEERAEKTKL